jgi:hypothetical protein
MFVLDLWMDSHYIMNLAAGRKKGKNHHKEKITLLKTPRKACIISVHYGLPQIGVI